MKHIRWNFVKDSRKYMLVCLGFLCCSLLLRAQRDDSWKLFSTDDLLLVEVTVPADTLNWILSNTSSDMEHYASVRLQNSRMDTVLGNVGFRLRGNTSRGSQKKSFKITFDAWDPGREFLDLSCLNLNGEHNDPSIVRSKLCFDLMQDAGMRVSRAHHARLYINGNYFGLYILVENIDKEFLRKNFSDPSGNLWKCLWPADLNYLGTNPDLYKSIQSSGRPAYELKTNEQAADFSSLARFILIINNTGSGSLRDSLEKISDPYEFLQYFVINNLLGSWDEYWSLMNNFYLYHEPDGDRMHLIPYDYDNTFGVDWFSQDWARSNPYTRYKVTSGSRPLAEKLLEVDAYRDLYTHFLEFYNEQVFALPNWESRIDNLKSLIADAAADDFYRTYDWGFSYDDFVNSYSSASYSNQHVKYGIKEFVNARYSSLPAQLTYKDTGPIVYKLHFSPKRPRATDPIKVQVSGFSHSQISTVNLYFKKNGSDAEIEYPMDFSPVAGSKRVEEADRWEVVLPPLGEGGKGSFYVEISDFAAQSSIYPLDKNCLIEAVPTLADHVVINELMAANNSYLPDQDGEFDDWLELFNPGSQPVLLTGKYLTDSRGDRSKWQFVTPDLYIEPGNFVIVWCDNDSSQGGLHASFKLSTGGEFVGLVEQDGESFIDSMSFGLQRADISYGRYPNASVYTGFMPASLNASNNLLLTTTNNKVEKPDWKVYPNPFREQLYVEPGLQDNSPSVIFIADMTGRIVYKQVFGPGNPVPSRISIPAELLPAGVYTIVLTGKDRNWNRKIIRLK
ncbi:MAG: CotH kinase family protein [Bacteroidales bacterium]